MTGVIALLFFFLLSVRFGFWFYSRACRASIAAGQKQKIAWVELGYYVGMIVGLIFWDFLKIDLSLAKAFIFDMGLQISSGCIDVIANNFFLKKTHQEFQIVSKEIKPLTNSAIQNWRNRLITAVILLTIGIQVVVFTLTHQVSESFSYYILAFFYLGVAMAAIVCSRLKIRLDWDRFSNARQAHANLVFDVMDKEKRIHFSSIIVISFCCVLAAIYGANLTNMHLNISFSEPSVILLCITVSAFFYEVLALSILDRIALEENSYSRKGIIMRTYGYMGISAAISFWLISQISSIYFFALILIPFVTLGFTRFSLQKRELTDSLNQNFVIAK